VKNYYIISAVILVLSMLPFFISYEKRKTSAREITLIATFTALAVVSRAAFYLIPQVKPIAAVVIVAAVCLGADRGFFIGAFSAFVSNFLFGQGYWTPFQMGALGVVGLIAGLIFSKSELKRNRVLLSLSGFLLVTVIYGLIVDLSTVFAALGDNITLGGVVSIYAAGLPFNLVFGLTTAVFLFVFGDMFIRKTERVITKYGIIKRAA